MRSGLIVEEEALLAIKALERFDACLKATRWEDGAHKALAERLQRKPPEQETATKTEKRKRT
jgi:hypothetical protein